MVTLAYKMHISAGRIPRPPGEQEMPKPDEPPGQEKKTGGAPGSVIVIPSVQEVQKHKTPKRKYRIEAKIDLLLSLVSQILQKETSIMATLDDLLADVADESTVIASVEQLLTNLSAMLANAGTNPAKLQAVKDAVDANKARLSAAVVANTPAATTP